MPFKDPLRIPLKSYLTQIKHTYLMCLVPAVLIPDAQLAAVVKECFAAGGISPCQHSVVERSQPSSVLIVWRRTQRQQDLQKDTGGEKVSLICMLFSNTGSNDNNKGEL